MNRNRNRCETASRQWRPTRHCFLAIALAVAGAGSGFIAAATSEARVRPRVQAGDESPMLQTSVIFTRVGGIAGFDDRFELSPSGAVTQKKRFPRPATSKREVDQDAIEEIARTLEDCGLFDQDRRFSARASDQMTYSIQYNGVTVTATDAKIPAALLPVVQWFNRQLDTH